MFYRSLSMFPWLGPHDTAVRRRSRLRLGAFVIDLTLAYLGAHPEQSERPAADTVAAALTERFPCSS